MSSMSENWEFYQGKMAKDLGYSKDTLRKYLDELVSTGYLKRTQRRSEKGRFDSYDYIIDFIPNQDFTVAEKPRHGENPTRENPALKKNNFKEEQFIKNINLKDNIENHSDFTDFTKVETNDFPNVQSPKVNPFTVVAKLQSEKEKAKSCEKNEKEKAERQPFPTYAAFSVFCQTFENLSGAAYPTDQNGHYIMMPKDAGQMGNLLRYIDKIDRQGDSLEALKVFIQAAWNLNDKWLRANFTIANIYGQASKIFTAYQTTSPAAKDKAYNDRIQELLAERMAKFQD
jgi:hypothetical protein